MFENSASHYSLRGFRQFLALVGPLLLIVLPSLTAHTQGSYDSGSTGADGPFAPATSQTVPLPASGIFNFTTINIPSGVTITFSRNANNTPVIMLATGDVTIAGTINLDGGPGVFSSGGTGGPGGFNGGAGGFGVIGFTEGITGDGPGGGEGGVGTLGAGGGGGGHGMPGGNGGGGGLGGPSYGTSVLVPLIGGSGGGGGNGVVTNGHGGGGGGGGGGILIASSGKITFSNGSINARGGNGSYAYCSGCGLTGGGGGGGAGGGARLAANEISGTANLRVNGGTGGISLFNTFRFGGAGSTGYIRVEAFTLSNFNPVVSAGALLSIVQPKPAIPSNAPILQVTSVAGVPAPAMPLGSLTGPPDITIPTMQTDPVIVAIDASNIPVDTIVQVTLTPENGTRTTVDSTPLAGTLAASTATASVTLPTTGLSVISATAVINLDIAKASPIFIEGERINRIEVSATFGGGSDVIYITESGKRVRRASNN